MRRSVVLALVLSLVLSVSAFGAVQDFGKFTIDVPAGWTTSQNGPTTIITKGDNSAQVSITVADTQGYSAKDLAEAFVSEFKKSFASVETPKADGDDDYTWDMTTANGVESNALLSVDDGEYCLIVVTGADNASEEIGAMLESLDDK